MAPILSLQNTFTEVYDTEADAIFRFCYIRVSDREQALDLAQETFVRLWRTLRDGHEMTNTRAFLFTVAHRLIIDWYRKKKPISLEILANDETGESYEPSDSMTIPDLELAAEGRSLVEAIDRLSSSHRQAVYLRFVEGMSPPDIGEILGISANAASVRINRGISELRRLSGHADEAPSRPSRSAPGGRPAIQPI